MKDLTIAIGADHAGYELKTKIFEHPFIRDTRSK